MRMGPSIGRSWREAAFGGGRVEELNRLVHPAVIAHQERWMQEEGARHRDAVVIVEAALILEAGVQKRFDKIDRGDLPAGAENRALCRAPGHLTRKPARQEVERRQAAQRSDEEKISRRGLRDRQFGLAGGDGTAGGYRFCVN